VALIGLRRMRNASVVFENWWPLNVVRSIARGNYHRFLLSDNYIAPS